MTSSRRRSPLRCTTRSPGCSLQWGGDSTVLVRLPSLVLGTAAIPVVFLLGRRVAGTRVGLFAAAILALSPFAIFYSTEARAGT